MKEKGYSGRVFFFFFLVVMVCVWGQLIARPNPRPQFVMENTNILAS